MLKAFLSHSSTDKNIVEQVADDLSSSKAVIDSRCFDFGAKPEEEIERLVESCDMFVLFLSSASRLSSWVEKESKLAHKLKSEGRLKKILIICLDDASYKDAFDFLREYNIVRKSHSHQYISRIIRSHLLQVSIQTNRSTRIFIGRDAAVSQIIDKIVDPTSNNFRCVIASGIHGIGRRSFIDKLYSNTFPEVPISKPMIRVDKNDHYDELYRKLVAVHTPFRMIDQVETLFNEFNSKTDLEKSQEISRIVEELINQRETLVLVDDGGFFTDDGEISAPFLTITNDSPQRNHPGVVVISQRSVPFRKQKRYANTIHIKIDGLQPSDSRKLIGLLLKTAPTVEYTEDELDRLIDMADGHPLNIYMMVDFIKAYGLQAFIHNPEEITLWRHRRGQEFIQQFEFNETETKIIAALAQLPRIDSDTIFETFDSDGMNTSLALASLVDKHIILLNDRDYQINQSLRVAIEKDTRFKSIGQTGAFLRAFAKRLAATDPGEAVSVSFIESGILASLATDEELPPHISALLLPSHQLWQARRLYDREQYDESLKFANAALDGAARLSQRGRVEAYSIAIRSSSRLGRLGDVDRYVSALHRIAASPRDKATAVFLEGFAARMNGKFPEAERFFRESLRLSPTNASAERELAHLLLVRGKVDEALIFARRAFSNSSNNPFITDILIGTLLNLYISGSSNVERTEIVDLLNHLELISGDGSSFHEIRSAELQLIDNDLEGAWKAAKAAIRRNGTRFSAHVLMYRIAKRRGEIQNATECIANMQRIIDDQNSGESRSDLRTLIDLQIENLVDRRRFDDARRTIKLSPTHDEEEKDELIRFLDYRISNS
jgi:tetratricopeptide (TPR) repeat protein